MQEVYRRKPAPPDWPRPPGIVVREVDVRTGLLVSPYCGGGAAVTEFFISGTEPTRECMPAIYTPSYDTTGFAPVDPVTTPQPIRPTDPGTRVQSGSAPIPRAGQNRDTMPGGRTQPLPTPAPRPAQPRDTLGGARRPTVPGTPQINP